jgi:hypothetical protein
MVAMERVVINLNNREGIIEDIRTRLNILKTQSYPTNPEIYILQKALNLEKQVNSPEVVEMTNWFSTGYAGRKAIDWRFKKGQWTGKLSNRESGIVKKEATGKTAEEMLRVLMQII